MSLAIGVAGSGKSTLLKPLVRAWQADGRTVHGIALAWRQSDELQEAGIPSFIVIDFEYEPFYNTTQDTIDKCSAKSLEAVGRTLVKYIYRP